MALKDEENASIEADIKATFTAEEAHLQRERGMSAEQAHGALLDLKRRGRLSLNKTIDGENVDEFQSPDARQLWKDRVAPAAKAYLAKGTCKTQKAKNEWWATRLIPAMPEKAKKGDGKRKVGEITIVASKKRAGKAFEAAKDKEGLYEVFGDTTDDMMGAMDAVDRGDEEFTNKCRGGSYAEDEMKEIALQKLKERNERVAEVQDNECDANDVTLGMKVEAFVEKFSSVQGLSELEKISRDYARVKAEIEGIKDENAIHAAGSLIWLTAANTIVDYFGMIGALQHRSCCAAKDVNGKWRIFLKGEEVMTFYQCVGTLEQNGLDVEECERTIKGCQHIFCELWFTEDPLVVDFDAKHDYGGSINKKISIPGRGIDSYARALVLSLSENEDLTTFYIRLKDKPIKHHRLVAIIKDHYGFGFHQNDLIKEFLGLEDGQSFEDHERFKYHQDLSEKAIRSRLVKEARMKRKNWKARKMAKWSDIDHLLGRSQRWKNSDFFCMHVSHSWNSSMAYIRILFGDWLYGFTSISYGSGSD